MSNLEVFWNVDQFQVESHNQLPLNDANSSDFNMIQSDKSNNDLSFIDYKKFLNFGEDQYQKSISDQLCSDDCSFLNQEQLNLIQNVNRDEKQECKQEQMAGVKDQSKEQKKQLQQIKNRISAQMSRDKKKAYVTKLEENSKKLEAKIKALEEENSKLKSNFSYFQAPATRKNFNLPKKEMFKYGFAFFSFMALVCSVQLQNSGKSIKQVDSIDYPVASNNSTLNSINYLSGLNSNLQEQNMSTEKQEQAQLKILPELKLEEEIIKEEPREEKIERVSKKIIKQKKPGQRKTRAIDAK